MFYRIELCLVVFTRIALYPHLRKDLWHLGLMLLISSTTANPLPAQTVDKNPTFASQLVLSQASFPPPDILEPPSRNIPIPETPQPSPVLPPPEELLRPPASSPDVT